MHIYNNFAKTIHDVLYLVSAQLPSLETILEYPASSWATEAADNFNVKNTVSIGNLQIKHTLLVHSLLFSLLLFTMGTSIKGQTEKCTINPKSNVVRIQVYLPLGHIEHWDASTLFNSY